MAAVMTLALTRACTKCRQILTPLVLMNQRKLSLNFQTNISLSARMMSASQSPSSQSHSSSENTVEQYPSDYEVSYDEFKYVEQVLPKATVPEPPQMESYPTPSGWFPPNEAVRSKQKFLVRRTKNHMLPVYSSKYKTWYGMSHQVTIGKIEGDIWALEAELRDYLIKKTGEKNIRTQVQEVSRQIRVRGLHAPLIAEFLLDRGM